MSVSLFLRTIQAKCDRKRVLGSVIESTCSIYECVGVCKRLDVFMCASMKHAYVYVRKKVRAFVWARVAHAYIRARPRENMCFHIRTCTWTCTTARMCMGYCTFTFIWHSLLISGCCSSEFVILRVNRANEVDHAHGTILHALLKLHNVSGL